MPTECSAALFEFARVEGRSVVAGFDGGKITSDAGALLLRASDQAIGLIDRFARCFSDRRSPELVEHTVATLVGQRIFGIALGYEDVLDHDDLRHDPIMAVLAGKLAARRKNCASVAGKSTLNRLELGSRRRRPTTRSGTTRRRSKLCWSIYLSRPRRVRRGRSSSISMPPTTRCTGTRACPGAGVVSRKIGEELGGRLIAETSQAGAIVVGNEGVEVGVTFGMVAKAAMGLQLGSAIEMLAQAAVEAFDHAVGLRSEGTDQTVGDPTLGTDAIEGMLARGFVVRLVFLVDSEAVGELGAVVGEDGVDGEREGGEKAFEEVGRGGGPAIGQDLEIDKAGSAVDGDIGVTAAAVERRHVFDIDVDEAGRGVGVKGGGRGFLRREAGGDAVALQTAVNGAARQFGVDAAPHRLDDVVERQSEAAPQLDHQGFFPISQGGAQPMRAGRSIDEVLTALPARHGAAVDAEFARQRGIAGLAFLDIGTSARRGRGIGVQLKM